MAAKMYTVGMDGMQFLREEDIIAKDVMMAIYNKAAESHHDLNKNLANEIANAIGKIIGKMFKK